MSSLLTVREDLAPGGLLRVAVNYGNPVLASRHPVTDEPQGVSVELAREIARRIQVPLRLESFESARRVCEAAAEGAWDIAFLAIDPARATRIAFTDPYTLIEGTFLVRADSPHETIGELDSTNVRIAVGHGAAYDLFLSRSLTRATLVRASTSDGAIDLFANSGLDAAAGVRQVLESYAARHAGFRVIPGRFMEIAQAIAIPRERQRALEHLQSFVRDAGVRELVSRSLADGAARLMR
jgi:polar amino acid transport system substrate-binding protein